MSIIEKIQKLERLHLAIKQEISGTPEDIAKRINISRACLYIYIEELKNLGAEIEYSRNSHCFFYKNNFSFKISITNNDILKIYGGKNNFFFQSNFLDSIKLCLQ